MNIKTLSLCAALLCSLGLTHLAIAGTENPTTADTAVDTRNGTAPQITNINDYQARIGEFFSPGVSVAVLPFLLPTLPTGELFTDSELSFQLFGMNNTGTLGNVNLYGLNARASDTVLTTDFYAGAAPDPNGNLIQSAILTPANSVSTTHLTTSALGDASLTSFLNTQYANGANAGKYVFLLFSYDQNPSAPGNSFYSILTSNAGGATEKPFLTFTSGLTAIPEPSSVAGSVLLGVAGLFRVLRYRRRQAA